MQRVGIGRAIVRRPNIFLMDEPLNNLDAKLREEMRIELKRLQKEIGSTILFVTHDQVEAMSLADRIAVLEKGVIQQIGTPDDIYNRPENVTVALSVGSPAINLIDALGEENRLKIGPAIHELDGLPDLSGPEIGRVARELTIGVRPEDITLYQSRQSDAFRAEVYLVNYMGHACYVELKAGHHILTAKAPSDFDAKLGEEVWVSFEKDRVHVFDQRSRRRITSAK
jgi:multiple sugar transport system ATP-binding protein